MVWFFCPFCLNEPVIKVAWFWFQYVFSLSNLIIFEQFAIFDQNCPKNPNFIKNETEFNDGKVTHNTDNE